MKILIWPGHHDYLDAAIKFLTHGKGSHAAFLRMDGRTVHEAFWPRVRDRVYTLDDWRLSEVYELQGITPRQHHAFEHLFDTNLKRGIRYSIGDLFRFALNIPSADESKTFCSRYVLHCCHLVLPYALMPLVRLPSQDWGSPRDLRISTRLIPSHTNAPA